MIACKIESFLFKKANFKRRSCFQPFFSSSVFGGKNEAFTFVLQQTICAALKEQRGKPPFFGHIKSNPAFAGYEGLLLFSQYPMHIKEKF